MTSLTSSSESTLVKPNVGNTERLFSILGGVSLALYGLSRGNLAGLALTGVGASFVYRGATGKSTVYQALQVDTAKGQTGGAPDQQVRKVIKTVTINKSVSELYLFWRNFENLPRIMDNLMSVIVQDDRHSHWTLKSPTGGTLKWEVEIISEQENEHITWHSLESAQVHNIGSVYFKTCPQGTLVTVELTPHADLLGAALLEITGKAPHHQLTEDLRRFKQVMEAGEVPTTVGQSAGQR